MITSSNNKFSVHFHHARGDKYFQEKKYGKALKHFTMSAELDPRFRISFNSRAIIFTELKQYDKAFEDYTKAIQIKPNNCITITNRSAQSVGRPVGRLFRSFLLISIPKKKKKKKNFPPFSLFLIIGVTPIFTMKTSRPQSKSILAPSESIETTPRP